MILSIIVATADGGVIGKENGIPWYMPADLAHFKRTTANHPIIMGRKTHESIGRVLPGRLNIIISRNLHYKVEGAEVVGSLDSAIKLAGRSEKHEAFIIGGDSIYEIALPQTDKIYLTDVHAKIDGDKFFKYNPGEWHIVSKESHLPDEKNKYAYDFITMERVNTG